MGDIMPTTDEQWQAESDARTLAEAETIKADAGRNLKAQKAAARLLEEKEKEAEALRMLANAKMDYSKSMKELQK